MCNPADFLHRNTRFEFPGLLIEWAIDMQDSGMHPACNLSPERPCKIRSSNMLRRFAIVAMRQHMASQVKSERCLADPLRTFKEQRMMHTPSR